MVVEKYTKRKKQGKLCEKSMETSVQEEQNRASEKNRRKAFFGLQLKYTFAPIVWLYGIVCGIVTGLFLYNRFTKAMGEVYEVAFLEQLKALPLALAFFVLVIGVQVILFIGFVRQEKNGLAMKHVMLPKETQELIRLEYSFLVTASAFLVYFLMLCLLLLLDNILSPETAYGGAELYPAFYHFLHMYRVYPIATGWAVPVSLACIAGVSVLSLFLRTDPEEDVRTKAVFGSLLVVYFVNYCFIERESPVLDFTAMLLFGMFYIGKVFFAYRRRQKDEGEKVRERVE